MKHFIKNLLTTKSNESKAAFTLRADRDRRRYARCHKTSAGRQPMTTRCLVTWKISIYNIYANIYVYKMDGERLVQAVRKYEILYVSSQKSYKSNRRKLKRG